MVLRGLQSRDLSVLIDGERVYNACPNVMDPPALRSFVTQCVNRIEVGRSPGRQVAEDHPDRPGEHKRQRVDLGIEHERHLHQPGQSHRGPRRQQHADDTAQGREGDGLHEELQQDLPLERADGEANGR